MECHRMVRHEEVGMSGRTLYDKLWDTHLVRKDEDGTALIYIDRHLVMR